MLTTPSKINVAFAPTERKLKSQYTMLRQALTRPRHLVHKTKLRAKGRNTNPNSSPRSAEGKLSLRVCLPTDRVGWSGKEGSPLIMREVILHLYDNGYQELSPK